MPTALLLSSLARPQINSLMQTTTLTPYNNPAALYPHPQRGPANDDSGSAWRLAVANGTFGHKQKLEKCLRNWACFLLLLGTLLQPCEYAKDVRPF